MTFRIITRAEFPKVQYMLEHIIAAEEFLTLPWDAHKSEMEDYLFGDSTYEVWALEEEGEILGCYHQRPNQKGLGDHIANGGYVVSPDVRGKGVGRHLGEHSIARAKEQGYHGIQFNFVVSTNMIAIKLWQSLGFEIIGTIHKAYHRQQVEYVDAHIMFKSLL
ncbi:MAG: GNAT family N-acetyltransferase [Rickettsiales bacterium]|nr:GNAT family N-acetyltransferase [Rickettsiales bacterium]